MKALLKPFRWPSSVQCSALIDQLSKRKHHIKQQLKDYDARFLQKHGRPPVKFEKEPIREKYESYRAIKSEIAAILLASNERRRKGHKSRAGLSAW